MGLSLLYICGTFTVSIQTPQKLQGLEILPNKKLLHLHTYYKYTYIFKN